MAGAEVKAGDTLEGKYKILKPVDEGGMGTVYLAEHMLIQRRVAIKILRPELAADAQVVERFMNEARAAGAIGHPHIVESTDMGFTRDEVPFIVFEYLEGTLLTDEIYRVRGLPPRRALRIATQITSALQAAHSAGIIHRDLKSDNIFLTDSEDASDHVKVLDFGISRFLETDTSDDNWGRHQVLGTPEFMPPEQILSPEKVDHRADIYALGVVLYEMLAARRPFNLDVPLTTDQRTFEDTNKLLQMIVTDPVPPTGRFDLPPGLEELIRDKLLAKDPAQRFQSMRDAQAALEAFITVSRRDSEPIAVVSPPADVATSEPAPAPAPAKQPTSAWPWLAAAIAAGGAGVALFAMQPAAKKTTPSNKASVKALEDAATRFGGLLDSQVQAARLRAEGIASLPMLRAAIETDAATLKDMVQDRDVLFKTEPGETLEIFQQRDGAPVSMLRLPEQAAPLTAIGAEVTRAESDGSRLVVTTGAGVMGQNGQSRGVVALARPVDLDGLEQAIAPHATAAALLGLAKPIVLTGSTPPPGARTFAIASSRSRIDGLSLAAAVASPAPIVIAPSQTFAYAAFAAFGLSGLLLAAFGVNRARHFR